ncbi:glycosyltransferase family 2 protein [Paracoccus jeotgali]|uniref:glycosyltransferase family 2 protein n=1 Tax=Paracoccus jeotgali TaxID=2065379 RepID=UPI0028A86A91|nr:glycosyltransferase family A protein [Paracoccus jeotgali]
MTRPGDAARPFISDAPPLDAAVDLPVSVIVASRGRPTHLRRCLTSLTWQDHPAFEVILVSDAEGLAQSPDLPLKRIACDTPNIGQARNLGLAAAAGQIVTFIDDDALAEPGWLSALCSGFADPRCLSAAGWTRDRDGFRWQARCQIIDARGLPRDLPDPPNQPRLMRAQPDEAISTLGTNCAFRAEALRQIGGFDPVFSYHLDESDVNLRMATAFPDALTAVVPQAQVIHARAGSVLRNAAAVPVDLAVQGRSSAIFARRHAGEVPADAILSRHRRQLLRHMAEGRLDPFHLPRILKTLCAGLDSGSKGPLPSPPSPRMDQPPPFLPMPRLARPGPVLGGWHWQRRALRQQAARLAGDGLVATLILLTPSFLPHRLRLTEGGWFEQTGGLWGPSCPGDPLPARWRLADRLRREAQMARMRRGG